MNFKPLLFIPPVVLGVLGFMWMTQPEDTATQPRAETRLAVRAMTVTAAPLTVSATGFGRVAPVQSWTAVSQVEGRVIDIYPDLAVGTVVTAGDVILRVDPTDYELAIAKTRANIAAAEASLAELTQAEENTRRLLDLEQRVFEVAQAEFDRVQTLSQNGTVTTATFDAAQKTLLTQENALTNLTNTLALYPTQRATAQATLAVRQAELAEAERGLANTTLTAPFRGRVAATAVEAGQFVRVGAELLTLDAIREAEVVGAFDPRAFGNLMRAAVGPQLLDMAQIDATRVIEYMQQGNIAAFVELDFAETLARYPARPVRFRGSVDDETGTLGVAVRLSDPLVANAGDGRPPLELGSFVSVVFEATPLRDQIAIPRAALHQDDSGEPFVFTASDQDRLAITPVTPGAIVGDRILITAGLADGDRLVLSDPRPAIPGLALDVILSDEARP